MAKEDVDQLLKQSNDCAGSECTVDEVADLIDLLKTQQTGLYDRVQTIKQMIKTLESMNDAEDREVDEVRETVRALFRVFQMGDKASGNDFPKLSKPTGWSGEVGKGPQSAY